MINKKIHIEEAGKIQSRIDLLGPTVHKAWNDTIFELGNTRAVIERVCRNLNLIYKVTKVQDGYLCLKVKEKWYRSYREFHVYFTGKE